MNVCLQTFGGEILLICGGGWNSVCGSILHCIVLIIEIDPVSICFSWVIFMVVDSQVIKTVLDLIVILWVFPLRFYFYFFLLAFIAI